MKDKNVEKMIGYGCKNLSEDEPWRIFHIMSEFVYGFEAMSNIGPAVSIFGSARVSPSSPHYQVAEKTGKLFAKAGFSVITGGGPGIMEAVNKGASEAGGKSIGLNIIIPYEQKTNRFVNMELKFRYFFCRKVMFLRYANGFLFLPGGYGTMDELFESLTLIQNQRETAFPVIMLGRKYWKGMLGWLKDEVLSKGYISEKDLGMMKIVDEPAEAVALIKKSRMKK